MSVTLAQLIADARAAIGEITPADAREGIEQGAVGLVLDVREPQEFAQEHLPGAINIPRGLLELRADERSPGAESALTAKRSGQILVYCTRNPSARSLLAARTLKDMGYERVGVLAGGLVAWADAGLPVDRAAQQGA
ncbi:MAG TPA: rhodanese-like domain-containing protein [Gaiellales bacterium]|jgi:rhodanese-related sulfurtransferase|nr:rhodanese-like domain-containing protein [Gaiellales bacterium]